MRNTDSPVFDKDPRTGVPKIPVREFRHTGEAESARLLLSYAYKRVIKTRVGDSLWSFSHGHSLEFYAFVKFSGACEGCVE